MPILPLPEIIKKLNQMLVGYYHYYEITDNYERIDTSCAMGGKLKVTE